MPWQPGPVKNIQTPPGQQALKGYNHGNMPPHQFPIYPQYPQQYPQNKASSS